MRSCSFTFKCPRLVLLVVTLDGTTDDCEHCQVVGQEGTGDADTPSLPFIPDRSYLSAFAAPWDGWRCWLGRRCSGQYLLERFVRYRRDRLKSA
jgi:hypothetical protein